MVCSKCKIDYPIENFQTYWHSGPKKYYRRKICKGCTNNHNKEYKRKLVEKKLKDRTHKLCKVCNQVLPVDEFYKVGVNRTPAYKCKKCNNRKNPKDVWNNLDYRSNPNEWVSDEQRDMIHQVLRKIGWSFNKKKGIWYKLPAKDKDGNWHIKFDTKPVNRNLYINLDIDEIVQYRKRKYSYKRIANIYKVSVTTIRNRLKLYNEDVDR